ncbi:MAG: cyclodeaminase/cyclohydrolase family protein [Deltaproteobacteria bacterium]|nr:cyclodeaminase/cyclohydrolase family protein [Deltaproteobacteria bacterium]
MDSFLKELAQARPDPGGGAAAAFGARLGLALLKKVVQLEGSRPRQPKAKTPLTWEDALTQLHRLDETLEKTQAEDVQAYANLAAARASGGNVAAAIREALDSPRRMVIQAGKALELLAWAGGHCKPHLVSDLLVACEFLGAALTGAYHIACTNLRLVTPEENRKAMKRAFCQTYQKGDDLYNMVKAALVAREDGFDRCR